MNKAMVLKENIKKYRLAGKQSGLTYCKSAKTFAEYTGINVKTYTNYEQQSRKDVPDYDNLVIIAKALCVSVDRLFNYVPPEESTVKFLSDLKLDYDTKIIFDTDFMEEQPFYILHIPTWLKEVHINPPKDIEISFEEMGGLITRFNDLDITVTDIRLKSLIFIRFIIEFNDLNISDPSENAERRNIFAEKIIKDREPYYYGFKQFRGGNTE